MRGGEVDVVPRKMFCLISSGLSPVTGNALGPQILVTRFPEAAELHIIAFGKRQIVDGVSSDQIYFNSQ